MATMTTQPPRFLGSGSASAHTPSSRSRASAGSMVTRGRCRKSSRRFRSGSFAASASLEPDKLAMLRIIGRAARHPPLFELLAVDGINDTMAAGEGAEDAELAPRRSWQAFDRPRLVGIVGVGAERLDARQHAIADAGSRAPILLALGDEDAGRLPVL